MLMAHVLIISGSPSKTSRLNGIIEYVQKVLKEKEAQVEWINVSDLPAENLISAHFDSPAIQQANELVEKADAIIVASPVYKASYTGVLKTYLDLLPQKGLAQKVILPLFIGGSIAHLLSIDYALKPVLSVLGARTILAGVYVVDSLVKRNEQGLVELEAEVKQRLDDSLQDLVEETEWNTKKRRDQLYSGK
jgi:FMN reductase